MQNYTPPIPIPIIGNPNLERPDWTQGKHRDSSKMWLDKNENTDVTLSECTSRVLQNIDKSICYSYPETGPLYRKLADHVGVLPENLYIAAGSDGVIRSVYEIFIDRGSVVAYPSPTFAMYSVYSKIYGANNIELEYQPSPTGPVLTIESVIESLETHRPNLFCLPNPDSPTGSVFKPNDMERIISAAAERQIAVLVDEAYFPFYDETTVKLINTYPNLIVARSTGKAWGMAGFRIGYAVSNAHTIKLLHKVRPMYEANSVAVAAFEAMLNHEDEMLAAVDRLNFGKQFFLNEMDQFGFKTLKGEGNFLHVAFGEYAEKVHAAYRKDFDCACLRGFSRFSATSKENFKILVDIIRAIVADHH